MNRFLSQFALFTLPVLVALSVSPHVVMAEGILPSDVLSRMNQDREASGLPGLLLSNTLSRAAEMRLEDMETNEYFAHVSPSGVLPWASFESVKYRYRYAGENLAIHFLDADAEETAWMASEEHRDNILNARYRDVGIAVREISWKGGRTVLAVVLFGTRVGDVALLPLNSSSSFSRTTVESTVAGASETAIVEDSATKISDSVAKPIEIVDPASVPVKTAVVPMTVSHHVLFVNFWYGMVLAVISVAELSMAALIFRAYLFAASLSKHQTRM